MASDRGPGRTSDPLTSRTLLSLLGDWASPGASLYQRLAGALRLLIERGDLAPGTVLPAERSLAAGLSVSRGTVMNAFEVLRQADLVESRQGGRTRVRMDAQRPPLPDVDLLGEGAASRSLSGRFFDARSGVIDLALALLPDVDGVRGLPLPTSWDVVARASAGHGYQPLGLASLRRAVCGYYQDRGLRTEPDQLIITAGAQQGIDLCSTLALRPGDCVIVESPTYPGAIDAFARHGARIVSIPFTSHWDQPQLLAAMIAQHAPRLVYLMPGMHNPCGRPLPDHRRRVIARLADDHPLYVIEDNTLVDTAFQPHDQPLLGAYSTHDRVLTLGSLSKTAWGGLRVGWIRGASGLIGRMARSRAAKDLSLSPLPQLVAETVLEHLDDLLTRRRYQLSSRAALIRAELARSLGSWTVAAPEGGLSLWVRLPFGNSAEFAGTALRHGVAVVAGSAHCVDGSGDGHLRIAFAHDEATLIEGVTRLATAWADYATHLGQTNLSTAAPTGTDATVLPLRTRGAQAPVAPAAHRGTGSRKR